MSLLLVSREHEIIDSTGSVVLGCAVRGGFLDIEAFFLVVLALPRVTASGGGHEIVGCSR